MNKRTLIFACDVFFRNAHIEQKRKNCGSAPINLDYLTSVNGDLSSIKNS